MGQYIVTDLTRFKKDDIVCTAVIDMETGACLRPMPYLESEMVKKFNMHPGAIIEGEITLQHNAQNPHVEDADYQKLNYLGPATNHDFKAVLDQTLSPSIAAGFNVNFADGQKYIPVGEQAACSIVTVKISPSDLSIHEDNYNPGKIKASITDGDDRYYSYLPITDLGFHGYAMKHYQDGELTTLRRFIRSQDELYLRVGVGRRHKPQGSDKDGFWLQVNGIYTFPNFLEEIRSY